MRRVLSVAYPEGVKAGFNLRNQNMLSSIKRLTNDSTYLQVASSPADVMEDLLRNYSIPKDKTVSSVVINMFVQKSHTSLHQSK